MEFEGYTKISSGARLAVEKVAAVSAQGSRAGTVGSLTVLTVSSLFTNSLACMSKLVQIIEFSCLMENFNFNFDPVLGNFLRELADMTSLKFVPLPLSDLVSSTSNSVASPWKGKLSLVGMNPYVLQEIGYPGLLLLVSHPKNSKKHKK